ncbi:MAG TPA: prolipoprotein diacylglyceryl transferase, partial [bacterium]|nr:prolipoprotein diacylglyceryl transferase [bacterium]
MQILGPFVHRIDPIIGTVFGVHLWWYGLSYTLGFLNAFLFVRRKRKQMDLSMRLVYDLSLLLAGCVLLGGRIVEVAFYEWPFYRHHIALIPAYWLGGMATHGLLFGGLIAVWIFSRLQKKSFLSITDMLAIPAAVIMGLGRLGNFVDGQIVGSVTSVPWAFKFPDAEGFRHPVVLYDGLKNLLIVPILVYVGTRRPAQGVRTGIFLFLYAFLRIFIDVFREYPTTLLGLATGQVLNLLMSLIGVGLIVIPLVMRRAELSTDTPSALDVQETLPHAGMIWRRFLFAALLVFALVLPSDWTQDVPTRYGSRHPGLVHSRMYPKINTSPQKVDSNETSTLP